VLAGLMNDRHYGRTVYAAASGHICTHYLIRSGGSGPGGRDGEGGSRHRFLSVCGERERRETRTLPGFFYVRRMSLQRPTLPGWGAGKEAFPAYWGEQSGGSRTPRGACPPGERVPCALSL